MCGTSTDWPFLFVQVLQLSVEPYLALPSQPTHPFSDALELGMFCKLMVPDLLRVFSITWFPVHAFLESHTSTNSPTIAVVATCTLQLRERLVQALVLCVHSEVTVQHGVTAFP